MVSDVGVISALVIVVGVVLVARRLDLPYTLALVVTGLLLGALDLAPEIVLTPHLVFLVLLPPLLFEASFNLDYGTLRRDAPLIALLAVPGVALGALVIAALLHWWLGAPWGPLLVFGALIAATDPVSVLAIFRELGAPGRLATIVEAESLFNDGTAVVLYGVVVAAVVEGQASLARGLGQFVVVTLGGGLVGLAIGLAAAALIRRINDHLLEITVTTIVAWGGFLLGDRLGVSGVITVVVAGLLLGHLRTATMSPTTRIALGSFWEYVGFLGNSIIFLLIGERIASVGSLGRLPDVAAAVLAVLLSRAAMVALANGALQPWRRHIPWRWTPVLWWGGVRGAVALALALSLPDALPQRDWVQVVAFGVVLFSLLGEGLTIRPLLRWLGLQQASLLEAQYERHLALLYSLKQAIRELQRERREGDLSQEVAERVGAEYERAIREERRAIERMEIEHAALERHQLRQARKRALLAQRAALLDLQAHGRLGGETLSDLLAEIDASLLGLEEAEGEQEGDGVERIEARREGADAERGTAPG